jgi:hypothetical protein
MIAAVAISAAVALLLIDRPSRRLLRDDGAPQVLQETT